VALELKKPPPSLIAGSIEIKLRVLLADAIEQVREGLLSVVQLTDEVIPSFVEA